MTGLFTLPGAPRTPFLRALRTTVALAVVICLSLLGTLATGAARNSQAPQLLAVEYHPMSKALVKDSASTAPLYDYTYRVDVRNAGPAAIAVSGSLSTHSRSVSLIDADAAFDAVPAEGIKASSDTIVLRAGKYFDRRLDPRHERSGQWVYQDEGRDGDDDQIPGLKHGHGKIDADSLKLYYGIKFQHLFRWSFNTRSHKSAPLIGQLLPQGVVTSSKPMLSAALNDPSRIDVLTIELAVDGIDVSSQATKSATAVAYHPTVNLGEGAHAAMVSVMDNTKKREEASWSFIVDSIAPVITEKVPFVIYYSGPTSPISAKYTDHAGTGVNADQVMLSIDGIDVTAQAIKSVSGISYIPPKRLADGAHHVLLTVPDNAGNKSQAQWTFHIISNNVGIHNPMPADGMILPANAVPTVGASFMAAGSSVNVSQIIFLLDRVDVSAKATITDAGISYVSAGPLAEGVHNVSLSVKDKLGIVRKANWSFVTRSAPEITEVAPKDVVLDAQAVPIISAKFRDIGAGIDPTKTQLMLDGVNVTARARHDAASLSMTPNAALAPGIHVATLTLTDKAGNSTATTWRFTLDSGLPTITNQTPRDVSVAHGIMQISASYQDKGDSASTTGIDMGKVKLSVDNVDVTARAQVGAARISYTPTVALGPGKHTVSLSVTDKAGNTVNSEWSFNVDATVPPVPGSVTPANGSVLPADTVPLISATYTDAGSGFDPSKALLEVDGKDVTAQAQISATGVKYTPLQPLTEGSHTVKLTLANPGGNPTVKSWSFMTKSAPVINSQSPFNSIVLSTETRRPQVNATFADVGSGIDVSRVKLLINDVDVTLRALVNAKGIVYAFPADLPDSLHKVSLQVADFAGNSTSSAWEFRVESPPVIVVVGPVDVLPAGSRPTLSAAFHNTAAGVDKVRMLFNDVDVTSAATVTNAGIQYTPPQGLAPGRHLVALQVANTRGVYASKAWEFEVDIARTYRLELVSPVNNSTVTQPSIDIVVIADSSVTYASEVMVNGHDAVRVANTVSPNARFVATVPLAEGENSLNVLAKFADGQSRTLSLTVKYSGPPTVKITSPVDRTTLGPADMRSPRDLTGKVERPVSITGTTSKPVTAVTINQQSATLNANKTAFHFDSFFLHEGTNLLSVVCKREFHPTFHS